jgi:TraG-like protein, N-terminal region
MGVDSYLELFTTALGWHYYNQFWNILTVTGIVFLPFFGILFDAWRDAYREGAEEGGATRAVRIVELEVGLALFVIMIAAMPTSFTSVSRLNLSYKPVATALEPNPSEARVNSGQSTFESTFVSTPANANVPVFWFATMAISSGLTQAMKSATNVDLKDLDQIRAVAAVAAIESPDVRAEVQRFMSECYFPVRSALFKAGPNAPERINPVNGQRLDLAKEDWIGSRYFVTHPILYPATYARAPVPGFSVDLNRDRDNIGATVQADWGRPTCAQWWQNQLLGKIIAESDRAGDNLTLKEMLQRLTTFSQDERNDILARALVSRTGEGAIPGSYYDTNGGLGDAVSNPAGTLRDGAALAGMLAGGAMFSVFVTNVKATLPLAQPIILFAIYMFLPFILVVGRYQLNVIVLGALAIFTVKFWTVMWAVVRLLDEKLALSMFEGQSFWLDLFSTNNNSYKRMALQLVILGLYITLPILWTGMMAWTGLRIGSALTDAKRRSIEGAESAGKSGAGFANPTNIANALGRVTGAARSASSRLRTKPK